MRKIFDEFFYVSKHGKVREKVVLSRLISMVAVVLFCLAAMGITAYAYFSHNITSKANVIKAARFEASVSIAEMSNPSNSVVVSKSGDAQIAKLQAGNYTVKLSAGESTAHKGFCIITIGDKIYYTDQLGVDNIKNLTEATVQFDLMLSAPTEVKISSHWGTSKFYGYQDAERIEIFIQDKDLLDLREKATGNEGGDQSEESTDQSKEEAPPTEPQPPVEQETPPEPTEPSEPAEPSSDLIEEPAVSEPQESIPEETLPTTENAEIIDSSTPEASE